VYLLIGHITRDRFTSPYPHERSGGTVLYAGVAARRLGWRVRIVTALGTDEELPAELLDAEVWRVPSQETTTFEMDDGPGGRVLRLLARAATISPGDVPEAWRSATVVHLAPVAGEVPPEIASSFRGSFVGATAQGWLREGGPWRGWLADLGDKSSVAKILRTPPPSPTLPRTPLLPSGQEGGGGPEGLDSLSALVVSAEDFQDAGLVCPRDAARALAAQGPTVALTLGPRGCAIFAPGTEEDIGPFPAREVDSTGAGDVFAAAFFIQLSQTGDSVLSARFASRVAALSIEGPGLSRIPDLAALAALEARGEG
jgi:sugar/nucleoside kinase (ribokinase family)